MSDVKNTKNWLSSAGGWAATIGLVIVVIESAIGTTDSSIGSACCCLGIFGMIAGGIVSANGAAVSSDGSMVLKQDSSGQWNWVKNQIEGDTTGAASHFNDQNTQIMSRVISEVRNGKSLQELETNELDIIASAYGVESGSREQKIEALHNSSLAKSALKLGVLGVAGGAGAVGAARIIQSSRESAIERAEELREQGREKLRENIEAGKYNINSKIPTTESGEQATDVANNIILDQLRKQIEERNLTPESLFEMSDANKDNKLDAIEIAGAMTAATGFAVPAFIVSDAMKDFDLNDDETLDIEEVRQLWTKLGFEAETVQQFSDEEIDNLLDEVDEDTSEEIEEEMVEEHAEEPAEIEEFEEQVVENYEPEPITEPEEIPTVVSQSNELSEEIETEFEKLET